MRLIIHSLSSRFAMLISSVASALIPFLAPEPFSNFNHQNIINPSFLDLLRISLFRCVIFAVVVFAVCCATIIVTPAAVVAVAVFVVGLSRTLF